MDLTPSVHRFVVTLPELSGKKLKHFVERVRYEGATVLELRGDVFVPEHAIETPLHLLYSPRGHFDEDLFFLHQPRFIDLDILRDSLPLLKAIQSMEHAPQIILSHHDYEHTPSYEEIEKIVQKMCSYHPWMIKLAFQISHYSDLLTFEKVRGLLNKKCVQYTLLGMGSKAHLTRIISPLQNRFTYTYSDGFPPSAEGQIPLSSYTIIRRQCKNPHLFGIIGGDQIQKSLSPSVHNNSFFKKGIDAVYSCFPTDDFEGTMNILEALGLEGLSVTAPFKSKAMEYADSYSPTVQTLGVANTLIRKHGKWHAENSDVDGVINGYPQLQRAKNIAILGAGGVVPAVLMALQRMNPEIQADIFVRDLQKAKIQLQGWNCSLHPLSALKKKIYDAVVCAITEDVLLPLPEPRNTKSIAIDLRYGDETKFLKKARKKGFRRLSGILMLYAQAEKQQEIFKKFHHPYR